MAEQSILNHYPEYECVIGIEVHVQLQTASKIFCQSPNTICSIPNNNLCEICAGYPGVLPVANRQVIDNAIMAGIATNCAITKDTEFARKHYFYPDLPKGYQITQDDKPICKGGCVTIKLEDGSTKNIRITRIHMEEDAGKNIHAESTNESFVDLNRAGTPLLEIVSEPDIANAYEARAYLKTLRGIMMALGITSGNMQEGAFRGDTNISVRKKGDSKLGTKVELKNINSFKFISDAIEYEIERQITALENGEKIRQETRLWDTAQHCTKPMRSKETAADYRYLADPDLPVIAIDDAWIERIKKSLPELPAQKFDRYCKDYGLSAYEAEIIIDDLDLSSYFEKAIQAHSSKQLVNILLRDVLAYLKEHNLSFAAFKITPGKLAELVKLLENGTINNRAMQEVFIVVAETGKDPVAIVKELGLEQIQDTSALEGIVQEVIQAHPSQIAEFKAGNQNLFGFFVGQCMKRSKGKGNPQVFNDLLKKHLA